MDELELSEFLSTDAAEVQIAITFETRLQPPPKIFNIIIEKNIFYKIIENVFFLKVAKNSNNCTFASNLIEFGANRRLLLMVLRSIASRRFSSICRILLRLSIDALRSIPTAERQSLQREHNRRSNFGIARTIDGQSTQTCDHREHRNDVGAELVKLVIVTDRLNANVLPRGDDDVENIRD